MKFYRILIEPQWHYCITGLATAICLLMTPQSPGAWGVIGQACATLPFSAFPQDMATSSRIVKYNSKAVQALKSAK